MKPQEMNHFNTMRSHDRLVSIAQNMALLSDEDLWESVERAINECKRRGFIRVEERLKLCSQLIFGPSGDTNGTP